MLLEFPILSETFISDEVEALRKAGHLVTTVSLRGGPGADIALGSRRTLSPWTIGRVASLARHRPLGTARAMALRRLTFGMRLKVLAATEEARRRGARSVHAHFAYVNADAAEVAGTALGSGHTLTVHAHDIFVERQHLERRLNAARVVVTVCEYNRRHLESSHATIARKLQVIPCSTRIDEPASLAGGDGETEGETDTDPGDEPRAPVVLCVGRLVAKKGIDDLIRAAAASTTRFDTVIIGEGPLADSLAELAVQLGVADRVRLVGALEHSSVLALRHSADVFCLPCKIGPDGDRDSMPVVIKEAMAAGLPVVSTDEVGVPEMVLHGGTGWLVPPGDPVALARALDELVSDPQLRRRMGEAGRAIVAERFDLRQQAQAVAEAIG
jgi:colanic acid/amylovoran biosynthesis glycosyltransferase